MAHVVEIISLIVKSEDRKIGGVINKIIEVLSSQDLEYRNIYSELFFMKTITAPAKIIVNKFANSHQNCLIPHQHFMAMVFEIIKILQDYRSAKLGK